MTSDEPSFSRQNYQNLFDIFANHSKWITPENSEPLDQKIDSICEGSRSMGEVRFSHEDTEATLTVRFPHLSNSDIAEILLDYPLDYELPNTEYGFIGRLYEVQHSIAKNYQTPYIEPLSNHSVIAKGYVPANYQKDQLQETVSAYSNISEAISLLHDDLYGVLDSHYVPEDKN